METESFKIKGRQVISLLVLMVSVSFATVYFGAKAKEPDTLRVAFNDGGSEVIFESRSKTVGDFLKNNNIPLRKEDILIPSGEEPLEKSRLNNITIIRAVKVYVKDGTEVKTYHTQRKTVGEFLKEQNINLINDDILLDTAFPDSIYPDMTISILRIKEDMIYVAEAIAFDTVRKANPRLEEGNERVAREGKDGVLEYTYKIAMENGEIVSKDLIQTKVVTQPVQQVIEYGTIGKKIIARGDTLRYKQVLDMRSTAYTASYECTGKSPGHPQFGITYTGEKARVGIVAVDPKVIPLGSRLYIEGVGNTPDYGFALAADIGSGVKNDIIDLYVDTQEEANKWGIKKVKVYVLTD